MSTAVPNPVAPYPPVPGQPSGAGTFEPPHPYRTAEAPADGPFGNHATLGDGLVSYWALDESSGVRADAVGSNDLTDNNTVGSVNSGPEGVVAQHVYANSESLSVSTTGLFTQSSARTISLWFREDVSGSNQSLLSIGANSGDGSRAININTGGTTPNMTLAIYGDGGAVNTTTGGLIATGQWRHLVYTYPGGTGDHIVYLDGTAVITDAGADSGNYTNFFLGISAAGPWGGLIARAGVWSTVLNSAEITSLFNSGIGKAYADLTDAEKVGLVSYWDLTETSGTRSDSHGTNHLTDNNTVTSVDNTHPGFGKAASFVAANDESLTRAYASLVDWPQADFHIAGWANVADGNAAGGWICRRGGGVGLNDWRILFIGTNERLYLSATTDGTNETLLANSGAGSAPLNQWLFLEVRRSGTTLGIAVNGGAFADVTQSPIPNGTSPLVIGNINSGGVAGFTPTAQYGPIMLWSRVLTAQERTDLYNSGLGLFYED